MRARTVALLLIALCAAAQACAVGFLTQKQLVGRDGETVVIVPPYTYVTVTQRFGKHAIITYRDGDQVRELHVSQSDLDAAKPEEKGASDTVDPDALAAFYLERVPFDVYIDEFGGSAAADDAEGTPAPTQYRIRIKTCNLVPEVLPHIRFEVQVYFDPVPETDGDPPQPVRGNRLWQLRVLAIEPREIRRVETPIFSADDVHVPAPQPVEAGSEPGSAEGEESGTEAKEPTLRFAVRLFVDELFVAQRTGIVQRIDEKEEKPSWATGIPYFGGSSYRRLGTRLQGWRIR